MVEDSSNSDKGEVELQPLVMPGEDGLEKSKICNTIVYFDRILWELVVEYFNENNLSETHGLKAIVKNGLKQVGIEIPSRREAQERCKVIPR